MQSDRPRNTVDKDSIGDGDGNDMGEVELHEIGIAYNGLIRDIANADEQQKDPSQ